MFKFETNFENLDPRSKFANDICQLVIDKHHGDFEKSLVEIKPIYNHFENHVRNVYELINKEIPLFTLYELITHGKDNYGITEYEYQEAINITKQACNTYYIEKR